MAIPGTVTVTGVIAPTVTGDTYPVTDAIYGLDGLRNVTSIALRNQIPNQRRRAGMVVGVDSTGTTDTTTYWMLLPEPWTGTDSDWAPFPCGINTGLGTYYVDKKYVGDGAAVVSGLTYSSITSTNQSYLNQYNSAKVGNAIYSFPCPFSARNKALDDISSGKISKANIVVLNGQWTIGSDNPLQNGNISGTSINSNVTADIGFSVANNTTVASIAQNALSFWFAPNTRFTYINSSYTFYHLYHSDPTDTTPFDFSLRGDLDLVFVYGKKNPDPTITYYNYLGNFNNGLANINLEYNGIYVTQGFAFDIIGAIRTFNAKVKYYESSDSVLSYYKFQRNTPSGFSSFLFEVDTVYRYKNIDDDFWSFFEISSDNLGCGSFPSFVLSSTTLTYDVNIKNMTMYTAHLQYDSMFDINGTLPYNSTLNYTIGNLQSYTPKHITNRQALISFPYLRSIGTTVNINLGNVLTVLPILGPIMMNSIDDTNTIVTGDSINRVNFHCDNCRKIYDPTIGTDIPITGVGNTNNAMFALHSDAYCGGGTGTGGFVKISGNYTTDNRGAVFFGYGDQVKVLFNNVKFVALNDFSLIELSRNNTSGVNSGMYCSLFDSVLINTTGSTDVIITGTTADAGVNPHKVYIKNVHSNNNIASYITQVGDTMVVNPDILNFIK